MFLRGTNTTPADAMFRNELVLVDFSVIRDSKVPQNLRMTQYDAELASKTFLLGYTPLRPSLEIRGNA